MTNDNPFEFDGPAAPVATAAPSAPPAQPARPAAAPAQGTDDDPFGGPAPRAPKGPRFREMHKRLLLILPKKLEEGVPNRLGEPGDTQDRLTADVIVLDGDPIAYGGEPEKVDGKPHDKVAQIPCKNTAMFVSYTGIVSQCREALENYKNKKGGKTMALGRLGLGEVPANGGNRPWVLQDPTEQDKAIAREYLRKNPPADPFS